MFLFYLGLRALLFLFPVAADPAPQDDEHRKYLFTSFGPNSFRTGCVINGTRFNLFISAVCSSNLASESLVASLGLPLIEHPSPYNLHGFTGDRIPVSKQAQIAFSVRCGEGLYEDELLFDVVPLQDDCLLLGRPWLYDRRVVHDAYLNQYEFQLNGTSLVLKSDAASEPASGGDNNSQSDEKV